MKVNLKNLKEKDLIKPLKFNTKKEYNDYVNDNKYINNIELQDNPEEYYKKMIPTYGPAAKQYHAHHYAYSLNF